MKQFLVLDDSPFQLNQMAGYFKEIIPNEGNYKLHLCISGKQALEVLAGLDSVDLILSDLNMPDMNGFEFFAEVLKLSKFNNTLKCFVTSESRADQKEKAKELGIGLWVLKPISAKALKKLMEYKKPA